MTAASAHTATPTHDFEEKWNAAEVEAWFTAKYPDHATKFHGVNGQDLAKLSEEQLVAILGAVHGRILYNAVHPKAPPLVPSSGSQAGIQHTLVENDVNEPTFTDKFRCTKIPASVALNNSEDVLLYQIQADAPLSFYVGILNVQRKVDDWISSFSRTNAQPKQVLVVDGHVKSGKTTTARYIVPWCASKTEYFQGARIIYVELSPLADARGRNFKERQFCEIVVGELRSCGVELNSCDTISSLKNSLRYLLRRTVIIIDEYHFLYSHLDTDTRYGFATQVRNMMLDPDSRVHFVITTSTQPLLWLSLNFSLSNGISLLNSPVVLTTPLNVAQNIGQIYDTVTIFNHLSKRQPIVLNTNQLEATVALQFQVLDAMIDNSTVEQARRAVITRIHQVYERDSIFFYSTDDPIQDALVKLANGVHTLPGAVDHNRIRFEKWITKYADGRFYLKDSFLAVFLSSKFTQAAEQFPEISVLWRLIPIGNSFNHLAIDLPQLKCDPQVKAAMADYLLRHPANVLSQGVNANQWRELFRLSRNILCHEESVHGDKIKELCSWFVNLFGSKFALEAAFSYVSSFLIQDI